MPQIGSAIAVALMGQGVGFYTATAIGSFLVNTVSSIALSALSMAIRGKPEVQQPGITTDTTTAGGTIPQRLILGRYCTAGQMVAPMMVYQTDGNPNEWLTYVISLADKPVTGITRIFVDGKALTIDGNPAASAHDDAMGATVMWTEDGNLRDKVYIRFHDGRQTQADAYLRRVFGTYPERPWTADMIGHGVAYVVVTFKGKAQDGDYSGFPAVKFEVDGHPLYDPRDGTQNPNSEATWKFTQNPAVIAYNILRGIDMPGGDRWGVGSRDFSLAHAIAAMNLCDAQIPHPAGGGRRRYRAGLEISVADEPHQALTEIVKAMGGEVADMGGTWLLSAGEPGGPVLSISDDDIIVTDSRSLRPYPGLDETVNAIHASYPDPGQQWEAKEAVPLYNAEYEAADGGRRLIAEVDFPAVPVPVQVRALMREMLADHRRMRTHVITLPPDALGVKLGEHIAWSSVINGYNGKLFKIAAIRVDPKSLCVALTITERDPSDYDYDAGSDALVPTIPSAQPVVPIIQGVADWNAFAVNAGGKPGIRIEWNPEINARAVSWTIRLDSDLSVANSGDAVNIGAGYVVVTAGLRPATTYRVAGRLVLDRRTASSQEILVTTLDIGIDWADFSADLQAHIDAMEAEAALAAQQAQQALTNINTVRGELEGEIYAAEQLAIDNLGIAQNYTDTQVLSESVARQTETGQLAARIDEITASPTSGNLLTNGDFADGAAGWPDVTVTNGKGTIGAAGETRQTVPVAFDVGEMLQWRIEHSGPAGQVRVGFLNASNALIGSEFVTTLPAGVNARVASGQHTPPEDATQVRFRVAGAGLVIDNAAVSTIDQQTIARIQSLEIALANDEQALATYKTQVAARFGTNESAINTTNTTLANLNGSVAMIDTEVVAGQERASITVGAWNDTTGGMTPGSAIVFDADDILLRGSVAMDHLAVGMGKNLLIDPSFDDGLAHYWFTTNGPAASASVRQAGEPWAHPAWPTLAIYQNNNNAAVQADIYTRPVINAAGGQAAGVPVRTGSIYTASAYISTHRCQGQLILQFIDANGAFTGSSASPMFGPEASQSIAPDAWPRYSVQGTAPANTVYARLIFRKHGTLAGNTDSYLFVWKPQLEEAARLGQEPSLWSPGGTTYINGGRLFADSVTAREANFESLNALGLKVDTADINNLAVTSAKMANLAVTNAKIGDLQVDTIKIADHAVTAAFFTTMSGGPAAWNETVAVSTFTFNGPGSAGRALISYECTSYTQRPEVGWAQLRLNGVYFGQRTKQQPDPDDLNYPPARIYVLADGVVSMPINGGVNTLQLVHRSNLASTWEIDVFYFKK